VVIAAIESLAYTSLHHADHGHFFPADRPPDSTETVIQAKIDHALDGDSRASVVLLGDSSCLTGLDAARFSDGTARSVYNLGTISWLGVGGHVRLLDAYIEHHGAPEVVVYQQAAKSWSHNAEFVAERGYRARLDRYLQARRGEVPFPPSKAFRPMAQAGLVPSALRRLHLSQPRSDSHSHEELVEKIAAQRGTFLEPAEPHWPAPVSLDGVELSGYQASGLSELLAASDRHGFELYIVTNPLPSVARTQRLEEQLDALDARLRDLVASRPHVEVVSALPRFVDAELCATLTHLTPEGARGHTDRVREQMVRRREARTSDRDS
jgi:hypothetical protein